MKGFKDSSNKFHPITDYKKGTRKSRDQKVKQDGVKVERKARDEPLPAFVKKDIIENLADLDLMRRALINERREKELGGDKATGELTSQIRLIGGARLSILALLDQVPEPLHREISEGAHEIIMEMKE